MRIFIITIVFISALTLAKNPENVNSIENLIESRLAPGQSMQEVEAFLNSTSWLYSYDRFQNRFQARLADDSVECTDRAFLLWLLYDCDIQIYINIDESGNYSGYSVEQTYSGV